jgi:hypothetical protein
MERPFPTGTVSKERFEHRDVSLPRYLEADVGTAGEKYVVSGGSSSPTSSHAFTLRDAGMTPHLRALPR